MERIARFFILIQIIILDRMQTCYESAPAVQDFFIKKGGERI